MTDIEIANSTQMLEISEIAKKLGLSDKDIDPYGHYKAKINVKPSDKKGKLILVTAINPTSLGEGKTTTSIGFSIKRKDWSTLYCFSSVIKSEELVFLATFSTWAPEYEIVELSLASDLYPEKDCEPVSSNLFSLSWCITSLHRLRISDNTDFRLSRNIYPK